MRKLIVFAATCLVVVFALSACGGDSSRLVGTWTGGTGGTPRRYEFNRDGTGGWGDGRNVATEPVWNQDLGRYVTPWIYHIIPTTWSITGDILEITLAEAGSVFVYHFEFLDNDTLVLTREGRQTGLELMRVD